MITVYHYHYEVEFGITKWVPVKTCKHRGNDEKRVRDRLKDDFYDLDRYTVQGDKGYVWFDGQHIECAALIDVKPERERRWLLEKQFAYTYDCAAVKEDEPESVL